MDFLVAIEFSSCLWTGGGEKARDKSGMALYDYGELVRGCSRGLDWKRGERERLRTLPFPLSGKT
jgi:hypothetical protein